MLYVCHHPKNKEVLLHSNAHRQGSNSFFFLENKRETGSTKWKNIRGETLDICICAFKQSIYRLIWEIWPKKRSILYKGGKNHLLMKLYYK